MFNDPQIQSTFDPQEIQSYKVVAVLSYIIPILFFLPVVMNPNSTYCKHNSNQSLCWFITCVILGILTAIIGLIPVLGWIINILVDVAILVIAILYAAFAFQGNAVKVPVLGDILNVFK